MNKPHTYNLRRRDQPGDVPGTSSNENSMAMETDANTNVFAMHSAQNEVTEPMDEDECSMDSEQPPRKRRAMTVNITEPVAHHSGNVPSTRSSQIPKVERMQLALTPDQRAQIELLRGELSHTQKINILTIINPYLKSKNLQIFYDKRRKSFICAHYVTDGRRKIHLYCPHPEFQVLNMHMTTMEAVGRLFPTHKSMMHKPCLHVERPDIDFSYTLAFAFCLAMGQKVTTFYPMGVEKYGIAHIHNVMADLLLKDELPLGDSQGNIWKNEKF